MIRILDQPVRRFIILAVLSLFAFAAQAVVQAQTVAGLEERIAHVENGLLLPTVMKGEKPAGMRLAERMRVYRVPGVSVAVINNFQIEWARGYGLKEADGKDPVTPETLFQAASISKPLTAMAALQLVEKGKLDLDEDVNRKLVSWKVPSNEFTRERKVTLRGLLSHSAGVSVQGFLGYSSDGAVPTLLQILNGEKPANSAPIRVDLAPGAKFRYSGGGYVIVQQLLADVSGKPFPQLMQEAVLQKLGMTRSTYQQPLPPALAASAAAGHLPDGKEIQGKWFVYPEMGPAGLWSTPSDLARFAVEILKSRTGASNKVLKTATVNQMLTRQIEDSGLGLMLSGQGRGARFIFTGSNVGYKSYMVGYLESGQGAVVMTNGENGAALVLEILRSIAREYDWPDYQPKERVIAQVDPRIYDAYVGEYEIGPGFILTIKREGDHLMSQATGQPKSELFPESETQFFVKDADAQFTFVKDEKGNVSQVNIRRTTREFQARKIK